MPTAPEISRGPRFLSRRRIVALGAGLLALTTTVGGWFWWRGRSQPGQTGPQPAPPEGSPVDPGLPGRIAALAGALCGHRLQGDEIGQLGSDFEYLTRVDPGSRAGFRVAADYVDRLARRWGSSSFPEASDAVRERIVDEIMRPEVDSRRSALLALLSGDERDRRRIRIGVIRSLTLVYSHSGPAWRRRGYTRWPGIPGDPREYTRPGPAYRC